MVTQVLNWSELSVSPNGTVDAPLPTQRYLLTKDTPDDLIRGYLDSHPELATLVVGQDPRPAWDLAGRSIIHQPCKELSEFHWWFKVRGPAIQIVDLLNVSSADHIVMWEKAFLNLAAGGTYEIPFRTCANPGSVTTLVKYFSSVAAASVDSDVIDQTGLNLPDKAVTLSRFVEAVTVTYEKILITKRGQHYFVAPEDQLTEVASGQCDGGVVRDVVVTKPKIFHARGKAYSHGNQQPISGLPDVFDIPSMYLREYTGLISLMGNGFVTMQNMVLPESYPHNRQVPTPICAAFEEVIDGRYATSSSIRLAKDYEPGSYFHVECVNSGHFGHLVTQVISRLWGWDAALADCPDLKLLFRIRKPGERIPHLENQLFAAYGIRPEQITYLDHSTRIDHMYGASPLWHNYSPHFADPDIQHIWDRMLDHLLIKDQATPERIFVSRKGTTENRSCHNTKETEKYFADRGYTVIYPEELSLAEQATIFHGARSLAGFAGSAMFNAMYCRNLEQMIVLSQEAYTARNEYLYGAILGFDTHYLWNPPDVSHPKDGFSDEAYYSSWTMDLDQHASTLAQLTS